jgi:hypothetical protein
VLDITFLFFGDPGRMLLINFFIIKASWLSTVTDTVQVRQNVCQEFLATFSRKTLPTVDVVHCLVVFN